MPGPLLRLANRQPDKHANNSAKDEGGTHNAGVLPDGRDNSLSTAGSGGDHVVSAFRQYGPQVGKLAPKPIGIIALFIVWIDVGIIFGHRCCTPHLGYPAQRRTVALVPLASEAARPYRGRRLSWEELYRERPGCDSALGGARSDNAFKRGVGLTLRARSIRPARSICICASMYSLQKK
jgi:hypothetical protein